MFTELFHSGGRTDMKKLVVPFRNFANAPKNISVYAVQGKIDVCSEIRIQHINTL